MALEALVTLLALALDGGLVTAMDLVYPGSRLLLENRVRGNELEIHYSCHATRDPVELVVDRYEKDPRLTRGTWRQEKGEHGFQVSANPELHVAIFPSSDLARHSSCRAKLEDGERTVLQVSLGTRLSVPRGL